MHENYDDVKRQIEAIGCIFKPGEQLHIDTAKKKTCGKGGKFWHRLYTFAPDNSHRRFIVGSFGSYKHGTAHKVEWDREGLSEETIARLQREAAQQRELERVAAQQAADEAALTAAQMWARGSREGQSPYLVAKGVEPESCRFLPDGSILVPLLRYDLPREQALKGVQRIYPPGPRFDSRSGEALPTKVFTKGFGKNGCAVRLGVASEASRLVLVCEGYATGLSIRMATRRRLPVYVALDAYNLEYVVQILRTDVHPDAFILICADDDWLSEDHQGKNPGVRLAKRAAKATERCEVVYPVFDRVKRQPKDTDFNDLHQRQGLYAVERQLGGVVRMILQRAGLGD